MMRPAQGHKKVDGQIQVLSRTIKLQWRNPSGSAGVPRDAPIIRPRERQPKSVHQHLTGCQLRLSLRRSGAAVAYSRICTLAVCHKKPYTQDNRTSREFSLAKKAVFPARQM